MLDMFTIACPCYVKPKENTVSSKVIDYLDKKYKGDSSLVGNNTNVYLCENSNVDTVRTDILKDLKDIGINEKNIDPHMALIEYGDGVYITAIKY